MRLLGEADVVVYDDLGTEEVLARHAPPAVERVYVGKRGGRPSIKQDDVNALLVQLCAVQVRLPLWPGLSLTPTVTPICPKSLSWDHTCLLRTLCARSEPVCVLPGSIPG